MSNIEGALVHEELSCQIVGAAMTVLNTLGPGLNEKIYENALVLELMAIGLHVNQQQEFPVYYRGHFVGKLVPDLVVEGKVIVDTKVVEAFHEADIAQVLSYVTLTKLELGLLINFKYPKLQWKRLANSLDRQDSPIPH